MARQAHFRALSKSKTGIYKNSNPNLVHHGTPFYHAVAFAFVATKYLLYYGAVVKGYALCAFLWGFFAFGCGGIGHEAATWFNTNFDIKAAKASSDSERWRVSSERKRFLQVHSTIVARRNAAIFDYNAWPKMGGEMPRAPREQYE